MLPGSERDVEGGMRSTEAERGRGAEEALTNLHSHKCVVSKKQKIGVQKCYRGLRGMWRAGCGDRSGEGQRC